jgi:hypothetical protein
MLTKLFFYLALSLRYSVQNSHCAGPIGCIYSIYKLTQTICQISLIVKPIKHPNAASWLYYFTLSNTRLQYITRHGESTGAYWVNQTISAHVCVLLITARDSPGTHNVIYYMVRQCDRW